MRAQADYRTRRYVSGKPARLIPNLVKRNFDVSTPNRVWVTDITYIRTWEGWLYLAVVMDLFSRRIIGWATRPTIHRELVLDAVMMAVIERSPRKRSFTRIRVASKTVTIGDDSVEATTMSPA